MYKRASEWAVIQSNKLSNQVLLFLIKILTYIERVVVVWQNGIQSQIFMGMCGAGLWRYVHYYRVASQEDPQYLIRNNLQSGKHKNWAESAEQRELRKKQYGFTAKK